MVKDHLNVTRERGRWPQRMENGSRDTNDGGENGEGTE